MIILNLIFTVFYVIFIIITLPYMLIKTLFVKPKTKTVEKVPLIDVDKDEIGRHLQGAVRCKTVSLQHPDTDDGAEFLKYHAYIDATYPTIAATATKYVINKYSLIYEVAGSDPSLKPAGFLAHLDVVPAPKEGWITDPFSGELMEDGYIYGRGAMDMKSQFIALMDATETLLKSKGTPKRTIYLCFGHDEEYVTEDGAPKIVEFLKEKGVKLDFLVDEGGLILDGKLLGVNNKIALIGTCEKGQADYELTATVPGGHSSMPDRTNSVIELSKAITSIVKHPMPSKWTPATVEMVDSLAPYMGYGFRLAFANRRILGPAIKFALANVSTITNSVVRTSFAPTMLKGSDAPNVIPGSSTANVNVRLITGQTVEQVQKYLQKHAGKHVTVSVSSGSEASPYCSSQSVPFAELEKAIKQAYDGMIVAPFMFTAGTDAKYYYPVCDNVFRFTPFCYSEDDRERVHAINERCTPESLVQAAQFFGCMITNTCY